MKYYPSWVYNPREDITRVSRMKKCICVDCPNKCYEYENNSTSDKAYYEWAYKEDKCEAESEVEEYANGNGYMETEDDYEDM